MEGSVAVQWRPAPSDWTRAHPAHGNTKQVEMVSFGVDPQWGGLLFSLCSRHEDAGAVLGVGGGGGLLFPNVFSDSMATSAAAPGLAADLVSLTGSGYLDLYSVSSVWAIIVETAKATGMVVLLGVGSLLFYRVYHSVWPRVRRRLKALRRANARARTPPAAPRPRTKSLSSTSGLESDGEASDEEEEESGLFAPRPVHHFHRVPPVRERVEMTSMYFGPVADSSAPPRNKTVAARRARRRSSQFHAERDTLSLDEEARDADVSEGSRSPRTPPEARTSATRGPAWWRGATSYGPGAGRAPRGWRGTPCSTASSSSSLSPEYPPHTNRHHEYRSRRPARAAPDPRELVMLRRNDSTDSLARRFLARDESFESLCSYRRRSLSRNESMDSLGFPRHARAMTRGSSFDSTCSELSLDASLIAELEAQGEAAANDPNPTLACLEQLQREIEQLKSNCLSLDEEFETFKCNRNLPGMSSLLETKVAADPSALGCDAEEERARAARACFAGLYSLTRITSSPSLDLSDCQPSSLESIGTGAVAGLVTPPHLKARTLPATVSEDCEEAPVSLEWDEELEVQPADACTAGEGEGPRPGAGVGALLAALGESMDLGASAATISPGPKQHNDDDLERPQRPVSLNASCLSLRDSDSLLTSSVATYELDLESELGDTASRIPELEHEDHINKCEEQLTSPTTPDSCGQGCLTRSSSSSGVSVLSLSRSLSGLSDAWSSSNGQAVAIGPRVGVQEYARREWQGETRKASTILQGYMEIPGLLGLHSVRVVRGDNYCSVRGALFQALSQGLPLPAGHQAVSRCEQMLGQPTGQWLRSWTFAGRLPYSTGNVEDGIRDCLLSLDSTMERLQSASDRESALANLLNADSWLDARLCEAAKLLMIISAVELRSAADQGQPLPLFAELLFARDSSSNPRDLMNNHLRHVGDTAGLEQVEMYLLGYSLGVRIRVVRPSAFGSPDYLCYYPDSEDAVCVTKNTVDNQKCVDLVAEDDRHYNVLVP